MKKMIAMILMVLVFVTLASSFVSASANSHTTLFEMQINKTSDGFTITDGVDASDSLIDTARGIDYAAYNDAHVATYGEYDVSGTKTPYLTFAHCTENTTTYANTNSAIRVPLTEDIAKKDALTIETWVRFDENFGNVAQWVGLAAIVQANGNSMDKAAFQLRTDCDANNKGFGLLRAYPNLGEVRNLWNTYVATYPNTKIGQGVTNDQFYDSNGAHITEEMKAYWLQYGYSAPKKLSVLYDLVRTTGSNLTTALYANKWCHIVVTREWSDEDNDDLGHYITTIYVDGESVGTSTSPAMDKTGYSKSTEEFKDIIIGSPAQTNVSFRGDIATFKIYDGAFNETEINASYLSGVSMFFERTGIESLTQSVENILDLTFTDNVKADTLAGNITLKRGEIPVRTSVEAINVDANGYTTSARITVNAQMGYDEKYTLYINTNVVDEGGFSLKDFEKEFTTAPSPYGSAQVGGSVGSGTISVSMPILGAIAGEKFAAALIVMDSEDRIIDFVVDPKTVGDDGTANLSITSNNTVAGCTVEAIVWKYDPIKGACAISKEIVAE